MLFLAVWLPATNHCYLEMAGIVPSDECGTSSESVPANGDPCDTGCKLVEKTGLKTNTTQRIITLAPVLALLLQDFITFSPQPVSAEIDSWPPDTLRLPQFVISTALPIRAPSFAS